MYNEHYILLNMVDYNSNLTPDELRHERDVYLAQANQEMYDLHKAYFQTLDNITYFEIMRDEDLTKYAAIIDVVGIRNLENYLFGEVRTHGDILSRYVDMCRILKNDPEFVQEIKNQYNLD